MTSYEKLLKERQELDGELREINKEISKLEKEIWGLDEIGEHLLLEPPSLERN